MGYSKEDRPSWPERKGRVKLNVQAALDANDMEALLDALPPMQKRFAEEYILDWNGSAAVIRAGSESTVPAQSAHIWLQNPGVKRYIKHLTEQRTEQFKIDQGYVIKKIVRALEKAEDKEKLPELLRAAELLARHLGMLRDKVEHTGEDGGAIKYEKVAEDADAFTRAIASLAEREGKGRVAPDTQH